MGSPSIETMWQEIRRLKARVCELEECCKAQDEEAFIDVWIDYDDTPVIDYDGTPILHGQ